MHFYFSKCLTASVTRYLSNEFKMIQVEFETVKMPRYGILPLTCLDKRCPSKCLTVDHFSLEGRREYTFKRTLKYDSHHLDKPDFVGSYEIGDYVYFFFREIAVEYMNCGKAVYSRIARVCKRDTGGKNVLAQNWATYLKARLNCSIPGEFPYYFNEIQNVYKIPDDDTRFYAVFTTNLNGEFVGFCDEVK